MQMDHKQMRPNPLLDKSHLQHFTYTLTQKTYVFLHTEKKGEPKIELKYRLLFSFKILYEPALCHFCWWIGTACRIMESQKGLG